jgi:tRNA(adenine34) deaminase
VSQQAGVAETDVKWMRLALEEASAAAEAGEVPIGAVIVQAEKLLARGANRTRRDHVVHSHAEIVALSAAQRISGDFRLDEAAIYVTVEPCLMCLGAIVQSRISRVVYGTAEPKFGALGSRFDLAHHPALRKISIVSGVLAEEAAQLLSDFFRGLRLGSSARVED